MSRPLPDYKLNPVSERQFPDWLKRSLSPGQEASKTDSLLQELELHTICESGRCPNRNECYSQKTATFMIMGDVCTRSCGFCSVSTGRPSALDADEPRRVAEAVKKLGLEHVVVTSVNRDDLIDEGAPHFVRVIKAIKDISDSIIVEILTPDFRRTQIDSIRLILGAMPDVFNHNVETVPRLYKAVRAQSFYDKSLQIFREIKRQSNAVLTKSGLMLGLGETHEEVLSVLKDLREAGCDMLTLGQYLKSSRTGVPVAEYIRPEEFSRYRQEAKDLGFLWVESAPTVRSSFHAKDSFEALKKEIEHRKAHFKNLP